MTETNNSKSVLRDFSIDKIINIISITLSIVAIVISIVAIAKAPSNNFRGNDFPNRGQVFENNIDAKRQQFEESDNRDWQKNRFGKANNSKDDINNNQNQKGSFGNKPNIEPNNDDANQNNRQRIDRFKQNNSY